MAKRFSILGFRWIIILASLLPCAAMSAQDEQGTRIADIRWTRYGVPHIEADDEAGLGYGIGYAYARDNACLLVREVVRIRGESSRFFGAQGRSFSQIDNLSSDIFYTWLNRKEALDTFWRAQPDVMRQLLTGYVEGFNRYLAQADAANVSCWGEPWLRSLAVDDLIGLARSLLVQGGLGQFIEPLAAAKPYIPWWRRLFAGRQDKTQEHFHGALPTTSLGSNAIAVGKARSVNGKGLLLANPHFPWSEGGLRFYQMHLSIPGQLDVMGAALPGFPMINIGFNHHLAWTHTVDTSSHFTLYQLQLDPDHAAHYLVEGRSLPLTKTLVSIEVKEEDGTLSRVDHEIYESQYGPVIIIPHLLEWGADTAFALRDANLGNTRVLAQWYAMNQAQDVRQLHASVERLQGIPWVNTLAADESGAVLYMNQSVVPYLRAAQLETCVLEQYSQWGLVVLDGTRQQCDWSEGSGAKQSGIVPFQELPVLFREDFVQNSNDSAWLTNPASPLSGFSPLVSQDGKPLGPRTRFALSRLEEMGAVGADDLRRMVTDNQAYLADLVGDDLRKFCAMDKQRGALERPCTSLERWDGTANLDTGQGLLFFGAVMESFMQEEEGWRVPFDPLHPVATPRGINIEKRSVAKALAASLVETDALIASLDILPQTTWGALQVATRKTRAIGISGGPGELGIYNVIESELQNGHLEVQRGSSYIQLVSFTDEGPRAVGLLTYSQSSDPLSEHYADQTELFSRQIWPALPFAESQIEAETLESTTLWKP